MRHVIVIVALAGCAVSRAPMRTDHPASASAKPGRLAGPPPSLRAGVVEYKDVPPMRAGDPPPEHHHGH